jgi:hypothetical protein
MGDNQYVNFLASQHMTNKKHWFETVNPIKHGVWGGGCVIMDIRYYFDNSE